MDFVIELQGGVPFGSQDPRTLKIDLAAYNQRPRPADMTRNLVRLDLGAGNDGPGGLQLDPFFTLGIRTTIQAARAGVGGEVGLVCICGFSKGCHYAVKLALELNQVGIAPAYIGLADFPLAPFGLFPPIPGFPSMIPLDDPVLDLSRVSLPLRVKQPPRVTPPFFNAGIKRNYFQNEGNGAELVRSQPRDGSFGYWWSSNMGRKEVHGRFLGDGWQNVQMVVASNLSDDKCHEQADDDGRNGFEVDIAKVLATAAF